MNQIVQPLARIESLDVLRGFALLGILIVNAPYFAAPWESAINPLSPPLAVDGETLWAWFVPHVFFEGKCIALFSMLFGASLYLVGGESADRDRSAVLIRRLIWLLLFGLIHATLIWYGDILFIYALTGFLVMFVRTWPPRALLWCGVALALFAALFNYSAAMLFTVLPADMVAEIEASYWSLPPEKIDAIIAEFRGGVISATIANATDWATFIAGGLFTIVPRTAGLMMIGLALFKWGVLGGRAPIWTYAALALAGLGALALIAWQALINARLDFPFLHMQTVGQLANVVLAPFVTLLYVSVLILLLKAGARFITTPLAAVGRMAFTNYIAQSLIMTTIFYGGRGFGLFGQLDRAELIGIVAAVWIVQLIWSPPWLARFEMGPLEWVWRRLSYNRPVAFRKHAVHKRGASA